jgi:hypothetical protein
MGFMRAERLGESWADRRCNVSAQEEQQFPYLLDRVPVGMQFADGRKATNLDRPSYDPDHEPDRPVLHQQGGRRLNLGRGALDVAATTERTARLRVRVTR